MMMLLTHSPQKILTRDTLWGKSSNFLLTTWFPASRGLFASSWETSASRETTWLSRPKTYHKAVFKSNTSRLSDPKENISLPSSGIRRKQKFRAVLTFLSALANPPPLLSLFLSLFSFLWWALKRLHLDKKHFWESFCGLQITWKEILFCSETLFLFIYLFFLFISHIL